MDWNKLSINLNLTSAWLKCAYYRGSNLIKDRTVIQGTDLMSEEISVLKSNISKLGTPMAFASIRIVEDDPSKIQLG